MYICQHVAVTSDVGAEVVAIKWLFPFTEYPFWMTLQKKNTHEKQE